MLCVQPLELRFEVHVAVSILIVVFQSGMWHHVIR